tara:strand:- start:670 stop:2259 length:1590 start_codon:yes stop_codon:yes gene_type:complete
MAKDYISVISPNADLTVPAFDGNGPGTSTDLSTGDVRRKYNFGSRVSELAIAQDPFFRFLSKVAKKPTDDPQFKFTEKRPSFHKRYAYVMGWVSGAGANTVNDATITATDGSAGADVAVGDTVKLLMAGDYKNQGNIQNIYGNTATDFTPGASGTTPQFFLPGQIVKVPTMTDEATSAATWGASYMLVRVTGVDTAPNGGAAIDSKFPTEVTGIVVKDPGATHVGFAGWWGADAFSPGAASDDEVVADQSISSTLERARSYVVGTAHGEGTGYPDSWIDQPYSSNHGVTQIWKTSMAMTNTARATTLKYEPNEWSRMWKEKLIEHKFDMETSLLFGSQYEDSTNGINYTQGAVDYVINYGNQFSWTTAKTSDDFLDDMSNYVDPRYNDSTATVFFVNTEVYNWMHKLGGYMKQNLKIGIDSNAAMYTADFAMTGKKKVFGVDITTFTTPYGDMNVARNIHLDGTNVKILGVNLKNCAYRPLVGNGVNRDTSVYVGVQTLENSGVDRRVDLILTEAGMEWSMAESHAIWT